MVVDFTLTFDPLLLEGERRDVVLLIVVAIPITPVLFVKVMRTMHRAAWVLVRELVVVLVLVSMLPGPASAWRPTHTSSTPKAASHAMSTSTRMSALAAHASERPSEAEDA